MQRTSGLIVNPSKLVLVAEDPCAGSHGLVYRARYKHQSGRTVDVAVKVCKDKPQSPNLKRLKASLFREVMPWHQLDHPNVSRFIGYAIQDDSVRMISEWQHGGDLRKYLHNHPDADRMLLLQGISSGLHYLHSRKIPVIHGDIKFENVLVDGRGHPKLTDFGISILRGDTVFDSLRCSSGNAGGTFFYMDPALLGGLEAPMSGRTTHTDIWAMGWLVYELCTDREPYSHVPRAQRILAVSTGNVATRELDPDPFKIQNPAIGWSLFEGCWDRDLTKRWSAKRLKQHLHAS